MKTVFLLVLIYAPPQGLFGVQWGLTLPTKQECEIAAAEYADYQYQQGMLAVDYLCIEVPDD